MGKRKKWILLLLLLSSSLVMLLGFVIISAYDVYAKESIYLLSEDDSAKEEAFDEDIQQGTVKGERTAYPDRDNPFFFSAKYNAFVGTPYGPPAIMKNCTWYAFGRFAEILGKRPSLPTCDAGGWYDRCETYKKGKTPKSGSVIVWRYANGGAGHVAVVEKVEANGDIVVSQSGYSGSKYFWRSTWTHGSGYSKGNFIFQGFIYQPEEKK